MTPQALKNYKKSKNYLLLGSLVAKVAIVATVATVATVAQS